MICYFIPQGCYAVRVFEVSNILSEKTIYTYIPSFRFQSVILPHNHMNPSLLGVALHSLRNSDLRIRYNTQQELYSFHEGLLSKSCFTCENEVVSGNVVL